MRCITITRGREGPGFSQIQRWGESKHFTKTILKRTYPGARGLHTDCDIVDLHVTTEMAQKELLNLNINKSCGPDEIHPRILLELEDYIAGPVALLFNMTIKHGNLPRDWKWAYISPIYKKGSKKIAENYRPISLTSVLCKLMESFIRKLIFKHLQAKRLLSSKQYGFINGRSTTTQLLYYLDHCIKSVVDGGVVDTIYLDFAKAFYTVPHRRLLGKLSAYGIQGNILNWIKDFLCGRSQVVKVNGEQSAPAAVISGIPQGTVLGPLLFVIYINDVLDNIKSEGLLFADDTKIFHSILTRGCINTPIGHYNARGMVEAMAVAFQSRQMPRVTIRQVRQHVRSPLLNLQQRNGTCV